MHIPLFAADWVGVIVGIIFLLVSAASAISNIAKEKNKAQPGKVKEKAALQKELEKFLQEAMNPQQKPQKKQQPAEVDFFEEDVIETRASVEQPPQRHRRRQSTAQPQQSRPQQGQQAERSVASTGEGTESRLPSKHRERAERQAQERENRLGGGVRERIKRKQKSHVQTSLTSHVESTLNKHLSATFGSRGDESKQSTSKTGGTKVIQSLLKNPQSFRQAIILNEILSPPKSRRRS
ncbi:MAG: hypothetical protein KDA74_20370 [Planctomycetaceae bacterium]|nr:hypothetical protein [Planctomycetaceae bacterium]MCA9022521.1 hypothetical protein [Planctomycetaceae bacterium]